MNKTKTEWGDLMRAANRGDAAAYNELLASLAPVLRSVTRRGLARGGLPVEDAEDIVQETLLAVHLKRQTWDESLPFMPWLRAVARNKLLDAVRRRGRRPFHKIASGSQQAMGGVGQGELFSGENDQRLHPALQLELIQRGKGHFEGLGHEDPFLKNEANRPRGLAHHGKDQFPAQHPSRAIWSRIRRERLLKVNSDRISPRYRSVDQKQSRFMAPVSPAQ